MNHNISHCRGEGCMLRDTCMHYQAHLEYQADEHLKASIAVPYNDESECLLAGQKLYWKTYDLRNPTT